MDVKFFRSREEFRAWLAKNHDKKTELVLGFYKKGAPKKGIAYTDAVDEAICYGWIDGVRRSVDEISYNTRFTPRRPKSIWSAVNIAKVEELVAQGRMAEPGMRVFEARDPAKTNLYAFEQKTVVFDAARAKRFTANESAWAFFEAQPPGYRRLATWWVMSAKRDETRDRRLGQLIQTSADGLRITQIEPASKRKS